MPSPTTNDVALIVAGVALLLTIFLVIAGLVAYVQVRAARKTHYLNATMRIVEDFGSRGAYADTDAVLGLPASYADFTAEEVELATWVTRKSEEIAFLVEAGMIPEEYIVPLYSRRILWTWSALQPYIVEQRRLRDTGGEYRIGGDGRYFERLAERARLYRKRALKDEPGALSSVPTEYRQRALRQMAGGQRLGSLGLDR